MQQDTPLISVVIPVYNGERTIQETLRSVLRQTLANFEILVINDGSTDRTARVVASLDDPRIRLLNFANGGLAVSRNRGIARASGQFIAFLDADDLWTPDKLESQYRALVDHPECAVAYSLTHYIDEAGHHKGICSGYIANGNVYDDFLKFNFLGSGSNPLIRREALSEVGDFDPAFNPAEDWDMYLRLARRFPFICVPEFQILYRTHQRSMSASVAPMEAAILKLFEKVDVLPGSPQAALLQEGLSNTYRYLTLRALQAPPSLKTAWTSLKYLLRWISLDHLDEHWKLKARKLALKLYLLLKIALMFGTPPKLAPWMLQRFETLLKRLSPESTVTLPFANGTRLMRQDGSLLPTS